MARGIQIQLQNFNTLEEALNKFLKKCEIRNLRKDTIKICHEINTEFINFVGMNKSVYTIDSDAIDDYIIAVKKRGLKTSTVNTKIRQVRAFVYFYQKEYKLEKLQSQAITAFSNRNMHKEQYDYIMNHMEEYPIVKDDELKEMFEHGYWMAVDVDNIVYDG